MQPIVETVQEDNPPSVEKRRRRAESSPADSFVYTVMCWILGVAAFDLIVGLFCAAMFDRYAALLIRLSQG